MTSIIIADTLPEELPTLYEGPAMNLPPGAELKGDGSVTLTLAYPKTLRFRKGDAEETLPIDTLTFRRMNGAQARKIVNAKDKGVVGFSAATGVTPARANLIINALDAADGMDAAEVVNELLGGAGVGLPDNAVSTPDGVTLSLLLVEHLLRIGIFDPAIGGDPVLFQHMFWFYSHPAVYIMILPSMGVVSEIIACFSRKKIFGYEMVAFSSLAIAVIGFLVWGHHMFLTGQSVAVDGGRTA